MNVIQFDIEVKHSRNGKYSSKKGDNVHLLLRNSFENEIEYEHNFLDEIVTEWESLTYDNIKVLNSSKYLLGWSNTKNIKFLLFDKSKGVTKSKTNVSVEVIAYGDIEVDEILNSTLKKIKQIVTHKNMRSSLIAQSKVFIYPFDKKENDIESPELKVRANISQWFDFDKKVIYTWVIISIVSVLLFAIYLTLEDDNKSKNVLLSLACAGISYIIIEIVVNIVAPFITGIKKKVIIKDLTRFVESGTVGMVTTNEKLDIPE